MRKFAIRLNALDFTDLQDRLHRPITILNGVNFKRSVLEHFIETFKELVALNGTYDTDQVSYHKIGVFESANNPTAIALNDVLRNSTRASLA